MIGKRLFYPNHLAREYVADIMDTGRISYGKYSRQFEEQFSSMHGCEYGVLSNSGTSSLQVALQAMKELHGWKDGSEVIVPALTFVATVNVVLHNKMTPVLVDVDPSTYNINQDGLRKEIDRRGADVKAIIPVHLFGQPAPMMAIERVLGSFAPKNQPKIIEDSCEAVLATHHDQVVGSLGDIGCFSTYMSHHVTAGVGGIATTNNEDYAKKMRSLVNHGMISDTLTGMEFDPSRDFQFGSIGHSFRVTEFEAALGLSQLPGLAQSISARAACVRYLTRGLQDLTEYLQLPTIAPGNSHSWMMYPIVCLQGGRDGLRTHLHRRGVGTRNMLPITNQPCYKDLFDPMDYPVADWINQCGYYVGINPEMTAKDMDLIIEAHHEYYSGDWLPFA